MSTPAQIRAMQNFREEVADKLVDIEDIAKRYGLPQMNKLTLIVRDPANPGMSVVLSNEGSEENMYAAFEVARQIHPGSKLVNGDGSVGPALQESKTPE